MSFNDLRNMDVRDLDFSGIGQWPVAGRAVVVGIVVAVVVAIGYFAFVRGELSDLKNARLEETVLRQQFEKKQRLVANLAAYRKQLAEMRKTFGTLLRQLPSQNEIDSLLRDISQTAQEDGLAQKLFQPRPEKRQGFYAEKPIAMDYVGSYGQVAKFVSDVAALPRIVTFNDFSLHPVKSGDGSQLEFRVTAVTYRYLTEEEMAQGKGSKKSRRRH